MLLTELLEEASGQEENDLDGGEWSRWKIQASEKHGEQKGWYHMGKGTRRLHKTA
jgi:hypothetical protein